MKRLFAVILLFALVLITGCKGRMFHITLKNIGSKTLHEVDIKFDKFYYSGGYMRPGIADTYVLAGEDHPLPEKATVSWITPDGKKHKKVVEVKSKIPRNYRDIEIYFNIDDENNVTVTYEEQ